MNSEKKSKNTKSIFLFLIILSLGISRVFAEWPTQWSGNLRRPVLFVHGINANMASWGAQAGGNYCENPSARFVRPIIAYVKQGPSFSSKPVFIPPSSGPTAPYGTLVPYRDLPTSGNYFLFSSGGSSGAPLAKSSAVDAIYLPPNYDYQTPVMKIVVGSIYDVTCADGSIHTENIEGWDGQINGTLKKNGYFDGQHIVESSWKGRLYSTWPNAWRSGLVGGYKSNSGAEGVAQYFKVSAVTKSPLDPLYGINHNGIEFYNSMVPGSSDVLDPFTRPDFTNGIVGNLTLNKTEIGQTDQLRDKIITVLDEYYSDWHTNPNQMIDIVAHSQGGLVTRSLINTMTSNGIDNPANHINSIVTLDTPHLGTAIATDGSGVPMIDFVRNLAYGVKTKIVISDHLYADTYLGPYHITVDGLSLTVDPFSDVVTTLQNFTATDKYLAYPYNFSNSNWVPTQSRMNSGQIVGSRSDFTTTLKDIGKFPINHSTGQKIPLTAYYGNTPNLAIILGNQAITWAYDACDGTADNLSYGVSRTIYVASKMLDLVLWVVTGQTNNISIDIPTCWEVVDYDLAPFIQNQATQLDNTWGKYSDFVVDESSERGVGLFSDKLDPFKSIPLQKLSPNDPGVPHMDFAHFNQDGTDLQGATAHGLEIAKALERPPHFNLSPAILGLLLN